MSAANPFAVAVDALQERFERLLDVRRDALHVAEIYSENKAVVEGQAVIAADALERLHDTRAALAVFERLASVEVEVNEDSGVSDMGFPRTHYVSFAAGRHQEHVWKRDNEDGWFVGRTPEPEEAALCLLCAALECRRRNEGQP